MEARDPPRAVTWFLATLLLIPSCTPTGSEATTPSPRISTSTTIPASSSSTLDPALRLSLPVDPGVRVGRLENGLTYYLRHNDSPGGRAELRLLVNAGSAQESDDQSGVAHFLEHMMFNGTQRFPRNELIAALQAFGPRFGPDINAHTTFDETVYELSLQTEKEELVTLGLEVLRQWADQATLTEDDVVAERGVVLDEWRLRAQGFSGRVADAYADLILPGSPYEGRIPIGEPEEISSTTPEELQRFYEDWYRPELMAVVAVGDFAVDDMEARVVETFGDLPSRSGPARGEADYRPPTEPRARRLIDEEATGASLSVLWALQPRSMVTVGDMQQLVALSLGLEILADRLNDDALGGDAPLLGASPLQVGYARLIELVGIDVEARPLDAEAALRAVLVEAERVSRHGISETEFETALARFEASSQQAFERQESLQDVEIAGQIVAHHFAGAHLMTPDQQFKVESDIAARLQTSDLETALSRVVERAPMVLTLGSDDQAHAIPDETRILKALSEAASAAIDPRPEQGPGVETLMAPPEPVTPLVSSVDPNLGYTTLEYPNGAIVLLWQSEIADRSVYMQAESFGGTSRIAVEDLPEAFLVTDIVARSGVGPADATTLARFLADRLVTVFPWISETREGLTGSSATDDVETMFQLAHLLMTAPRMEDQAIAAVVDEIATLNESRADIPEVLFDEALIEAYYGDDPRYFAIPSPEQMADFDPAAAEQAYLDRFGDAADFVFALVGDFDISEMTALASRYVGSLPAADGDGGFLDHQPLPPRRVVVTTVEAGSDEQGRLGMFFTNPFQPRLEDRLAARMLQLIVDNRLRERIREELSATYSIFSSIDLQREPDPFVESFVSSTGHPNDLGRISDEVMADLAELQASGPTAEEMATAVEQLRSEIDLINNPTLAEALVTSRLYPDQPVVELSRRYEIVETITAEDIRVLSKTVFNPEQRIEIRRVPRD